MSPPAAGLVYLAVAFDNTQQRSQSNKIRWRALLCCQVISARHTIFSTIAFKLTQKIVSSVEPADSACGEKTIICYHNHCLFHLLSALDL